MDWDLIVDVICDHVKDGNIREDIYRKLLEESNDSRMAEDSLGIDDVFDKVYIEMHDQEDEDLYEEDNDDFGYED
jgi:hypothetical protein